MKKIVSCLPPGVWALVIFFLSSQERVRIADQPLINFAFFKFLHVVEYFIFFILIYRAFHISSTWRKKDKLFVTFIFALIYALSDELHQQFVPTREGKIRDAFIDSLGLILAWRLLWTYIPRLPIKLEKWAKSLQLA